MTELKTQRNDDDVRSYLDSVENQRRREDSLVLLDVMGEIAGEPAEMWGRQHRWLRQLSLRLRE